MSVNFNLKDADSVKSFVPLTPGEKVSVIIQSVEISKDGDLDINFKGSSIDNAGIYNLRTWANRFDVTSEKFNAKLADDDVAKIRQVMEAYLTDAEVSAVGGSSWNELAANVLKALSSKAIGVPTLIKLIYQGQSDEKITTPRYGSFISTDHRPRALKLESKTAPGTNVPYDRVEKLEFYGILPSNDGPNEQDDVSISPFASNSATETVPAFAK